MGSSYSTHGVFSAWTKAAKFDLTYIILGHWVVKVTIILEKGSNVIRITEKRTAAEQKVYSEGAVNKPNNIDAILKHI